MEGGREIAVGKEGREEMGIQVEGGREIAVGEEGRRERGYRWREEGI